MPLFLSIYENKIDKKGRISVPAPFRAVLTDQAFQGVVLFKSTAYACLEGFDYGTMAELGERLDQFAMFSNQQDDLAAAMFGEAIQCPFDGEGRIGVPETLVKFANLGDSAAFVGLGRKFQIWNPADYEKRRVTARKNVIDQGLTLPPRNGSPS